MYTPLYIETPVHEVHHYNTYSPKNYNIIHKNDLKITIIIILRIPKTDLDAKTDCYC